MVICQFAIPIISGGGDSGQISGFQGLVTLTLTLDCYTAYHHASLVDLYLHTKLKKETFCGRTEVFTEGRTDVWTNI